MEKITISVFSMVWAVASLLYGLGCESNSRDPWLVAQIPASWLTLGIELPRIVVLAVAAAWIYGGTKLIVDAISRSGSLNAFVNKLRSGKNAAEVLAEAVTETAWSSEVHKLAACSIIRGDSYSNAINTIVLQSGKPLYRVVPWYKESVDLLTKKCALIRQAIARAGLSDHTLPEVVFPAVRVISPPRRSWTDLVTKVDLTHRAYNAVINKGDLIFSYGGRLIENAEQLYNLALTTRPSDRVWVSVLRREKKVYRGLVMRALMIGMDEGPFERTVHVQLLGGPIEGNYETHGPPQKQYQDRAMASPEGAPTVAELRPSPFKGSNPQCGIQLLGGSETAAKVVKGLDMQLRCTVCGKLGRIPCSAARMKVKCLNCGHRFNAPSLAEKTTPRIPEAPKSVRTAENREVPVAGPGEQKLGLVSFVILLRWPDVTKAQTNKRALDCFNAIASSDSSPPYPFDVVVAEAGNLSGAVVICYCDNSEGNSLPPDDEYWGSIIPWLREVCGPNGWTDQEFYGRRTYPLVGYWGLLNIIHRQRISSKPKATAASAPPVREGMRYNDVVNVLGCGFNHIHLQGQDFYLFRGPDESDYIIRFINGISSGISSSKRLQGQLYGD